MDNYHYGVIGNCKSAAIISQKGSIDWCCLPNFDSSSVFARLIDEKKGGFFSIEVEKGYKITQKYLRNNNILVTRFTYGEDEFEIRDFMPRYREENNYYCPPDIIRFFQYKKGNPEFKIHYNPKLNYAYGKINTFIDKKEDSIKSTPQEVDSKFDYSQYNSIYLYSSFNLEDILQKNTIVIKQNEFILLSYNQKIVTPNLSYAYRQMQKTKVYWLNWIEESPIYTHYSKNIIRSALVLKMMSYQKTGAVLAALTTSLPETIGEERNWDYRFCWIRDASMTISIMSTLGHVDTVKNFINYILNLISYKDEKIQIMYGINSEKKLSENILSHLSGYKNSKPVRVGNAAYDQRQNDVYGPLFDVFYKSLSFFVGQKIDIVESIWTTVRSLIKKINKEWKKPDKGIWEYRGEEKHFVFSKVMCWVAFDRAVKIATFLGKNALANDWRAILYEIKEDVLQNGWCEEKKAFTQYYGSKNMDAANLLMEEYGFINAADPKYQSTVKATYNELHKNGLMYRYIAEDDFGIPKSSFTVCSFWMVNSLYRIGEKEKAIKMFESLLKYTNHVNLLAEDMDFKTKRLLGNFPQAYSHLALISCALTINNDKPQNFNDILRNQVITVKYEDPSLDAFLCEIPLRK